jgi:transposase-like protein
MKNQFKGRHFTSEIILFCLRWYLQSPLSYQQVADLVTERGFKINKSTVWRWVLQCYSPKLRHKLTKYLKSSTTVHHYDETYIKVRGKLRYLYRAIDSNGNTLDFVLTIRKDKSSAIRFLKKVLSQDHVNRPGTIVTDKNPSYAAAIKSLKKDNILKQNLRHVKHKRRNNILESDHCFVKRRIKYCLWFQEFHCAQRTIAGYESMHMIRKGQMRYVVKYDPISQKRFVENIFGVAA